MNRYKHRGHKQVGTKPFLDAIDKYDISTIHQCLSEENVRGSDLLEGLSKQKFSNLWECVRVATLTLPPVNKPLSALPKDAAVSKVVAEIEEGSLAADMHASPNADKATPMETEEEEQKLLPEDVNKRAKIVITVLKQIISHFASKYKEPSNIATIVPVLNFLLTENCHRSEAMYISEVMCRKKWSNWEMLAEASIKILLRKLFESNPTKADVKRLIQYRETISVTTPWLQDMCPLLLKCLSNKVVLSEPTSAAFLAHLFCLKTDITLMCHETLKTEIVKPGVTRQQCKMFGRIIGLACLNASPEIQEVLKQKCVQFFLWKYIRLSWKDENTMRPLGLLLHELVLELHAFAKKHPLVLTLLMDAYDPILWRHLTNSNNNYRVNATRLLFDLFPLERPGSGRVENEQLLKLQYNHIVGTLDDQSHLVRLIAVKEVCRILSNYWECLPSLFRIKATHCIITKLAFDRATVEIRKQALLGLAHAIEHGPYSLTTYLGPHLCKLRPLIYDESKVVCRATVHLLQAVQIVKHPKVNIKGEDRRQCPSCWEVVPPKYIVRLLGAEENTSPMMKPLVKLMHHSLHPSEPEKLKQRSLVKRVSWLIKQDINAARNFYQNSAEVLPLRNAVRFMQKVLIVLGKYYQRKDDPQKMASKSKKRKRATEDDKENSNKGNSQEEESEPEGSSSSRLGMSSQELDFALDEISPEQGGSSHATSTSSLSLEDPSIVAGLLDIVVVLWLLHQTALAKDENISYSDKLMLISKDALQILFKNWRDHERVMHPLLLLASFLPMKRVRHLVSFSLSQLRCIAQKPGAMPTNLVNLLLTSLCNWNSGEEVLEIIGEALSQAIEAALPGEDSNAPRKKKKRQVAFEVVAAPRPDIVLEYARLLFLHPINNEYIVGKVYKGMRELCAKLEPIKELVHYRLQQGIPCSTISDEIIHQCFLRYMKLITYMKSPPQDPFDCASKYMEALDWAEESLLPFSNEHQMVVQELMTQSMPLVAQLLMDFLRCASYMLHTDRGNLEVCERLLTFCEACLESAAATYVIPGVFNVISAVSHHGACVINKQRSGTFSRDLFDTIVPNLLVLAASKCNDNKKISLPLHEERANDVNEIESNMEILIVAFITVFPNVDKSIKYSEQVLQLCTNIIRIILNIVQSDLERPGLSFPSQYFLMSYINASIEPVLIYKPLIELIYNEFGQTEEGREAVQKLLRAFSMRQCKGVMSASQLAECHHALESCTAAAADTMELVEEMEEEPEP